MRKVLWGLGWMGLGIAAGVLAMGWWRMPRRAEFTSRDTGVTIEQVRALASLVTSRVQVADVMATDLSGYSGGIRVLLVMDLGQARLEQVDEIHKTAVLLLPQPQASTPRLDMEGTRLYSVDEYGPLAVGAGG